MEEANKIVHPVTSEWHYPILTKLGFKSLTDSGIGLVRRYQYNHQSFPSKKVVYSVGVNADYWQLIDDKNGEEKYGYWSTLESSLLELILTNAESTNENTCG